MKAPKGFWENKGVKFCVRKPRLPKAGFSIIINKGDKYGFIFPMKKYIVTVTLNPAIDKTIQIRGFCTGFDFRQKEVHLSAGGKGLNVSRALKSLGIKTLSTGLLGGFSGQFIQEELKKEGLKSNFFFGGAETRTNLTIIDPKQKRITRVLEQGGTVPGTDLKQFERKYKSLLPQSRYVILSGSIPPDVPINIYARLINFAKQKGVKTILDTSGEPLRAGLRARPFLVKPNLKEAESVRGRPLNTRSSVKAAVNYFHKLGIKMVIISLGGQGAVVSDGQEIFRAKAPQVRGKNNVGCGDALLAGFLASLEKNKGLPECLAFAVACGTANLLNIQPGCISRTDVIKLFKKIKISRVR